ncbi:MAG: hypothetical protein IJB52_10280 [Clostridia bacterium]|nr:hypothetical protein [Clostridia bacterium]
MKNDILNLIKESLVQLEQIPVTDFKDCYRKVLIRDKLALVYKTLEQTEFTEKKEETHEDTGVEG